MDSPRPAPTSASPRPTRDGVVAGLVLGATFFVLALPVMLRSSRAEFDEVTFHLPAVLKFAREWPHFDFRSYTSATTPGYHLVLAAVARFVSDDVRLLRVVGSMFTVGMLVTAGVVVGRRTRALPAVMLCLPLLFSPYIFRTGIWVIPQNAGWWGVLAVLAIALRPKTDWMLYVGGALALAALVFVRQLHLWAASTLWLAAWLGTEPDGISSKLRRAVLMGVLTLPAFAIVYFFFKLWGGMVPAIYNTPSESPGGQKYIIAGVNSAVPATVLALTALFGLFFLPFAWRRAADAVRADRRTVGMIVASTALGLLVGAAPHTSYSFDAGRWSGVWNIVRRLPTVADRSPLVVALAAAGGAMLGIWFAALGRRDRWIFVGAWFAFTVTQCFSAVAWQRYYEPFLLMLFPLAVARMAAPGPEPDDELAAAPRATPTVAYAGPLVLTAILAVLTAATMVNAMGLGSAPATAPATSPLTPATTDSPAGAAEGAR